MCSWPLPKNSESESLLRFAFKNFGSLRTAKYGCFFPQVCQDGSVLSEIPMPTPPFSRALRLARQEKSHPDDLCSSGHFNHLHLQSGLFHADTQDFQPP